jgi:hypothetical protein
LIDECKNECKEYLNNIYQKSNRGIYNYYVAISKNNRLPKKLHKLNRLMKKTNIKYGSA